MGHQIQLLLNLESGVFLKYNNKAAKEEICAIAKNKYGDSNRFISHYGETNEREWFAEVFKHLRQSTRSGKRKTALDRSMKDYLNKNGLNKIG